MERRQIFKFLADVATLAAQHFGEPPPQATEPEPSKGPDRSAAPDGREGASTADTERDQDLMASIAREMASVFDDDDDDRAPAAPPRPSPPVEYFARQLAIERTTNESLRLQIASLRDALDTAQGRHRPTAGEVLRCPGEVAQGHPAATNAGCDSLADFVTSAHEVRRDREAERGAGAPTTARLTLDEFVRGIGEAMRTRGRDIEAELEVDFSQMACGATVPLHMDVAGEPRTVDVAVPAGITDGATLTVPARGGAGAPPRDLLVRVRVIPDLALTRDGNNITMRVPVPPEALARKKLSVEAPTGSLTVSITAEHLGHTLRCKGKGIAPAGQQAGDLLITLDPGLVLAASIDQFPSAAAAFDALRSLCPGARAHLANMMGWAEHASDRRDIRDVLWALAVAHERGLRAPISALAAPLVGELIKHGSLRPSDSWRSRRCHVFAWLDGKSSLVTRERPPTSSGVLWTVHLEHLGDERHWSRVKTEAVVTH